MLNKLPHGDMLPDLHLLDRRVPFNKIKEENALSGDLRGRNVLVTGGTSGIGAAIMLAFAERGANIHIAGRNRDAAEALLWKAKVRSKYPSGDQKFEFHSFDASVIAPCKQFAEEMLALFQAQGGLDFLVMTQGGLGSLNGERKVTKDGHEWFLALHDFSRYIIAVTLLPALKQGEHPGVVLDVLSAGVWNKFDLEDLELERKSPNFYNVAARDGPIHDILTIEFNERCPEVRYNHLYPGPTQTSMSSNSNFILKLGFALTSRVIGQTPEHFAEIAYNIGTKWEEGRTPDENCRAWGAYGEAVSPREYPKQPEVREKTLAFLEQQTGLVIQK
ncbi:hypothetical protein FRB99_007317 [Tulasnella sp. 403]|nr:hypothetical protein FRB99_007317 [Tulasnella sp. 403]